MYCFAENCTASKKINPSTGEVYDTTPHCIIYMLRGNVNMAFSAFSFFFSFCTCEMLSYIVL